MEATNVFGRKLRELRYRRGYSLQKLAVRLAGVREAPEEEARGVNKSYISDLERGAKPCPSRKQVEKLAVALRCTDAEMEELFLAAGYVPPGKAGLMPMNELAGALSEIGSAAGTARFPGEQRAAPGGWPLPLQGGVALFPDHDFVVRVCDGIGGGLYEEGDVLLVKTAEEVCNGTPVVCRVGSDILVRRYEKHGRTVTLNPPDERYEDVASGRVKVLGQIVGFVRRC